MEIVYIDMDGVLCDYNAAKNEALKRNPEQKFPQSEIGFFENLNPIENSIESINYLKSIEHIDVYILTAPSVKNPHCYTEKRLWIEKHLGIDMTEKLIITANKGLNKGEYLIDDHISGKGQENFEGIILQFGSEKFPSWKEILTHLDLKNNGKNVDSSDDTNPTDNNN